VRLSYMLDARLTDGGQAPCRDDHGVVDNRGLVEDWTHGGSRELGGSRKLGVAVSWAVAVGWGIAVRCWVAMPWPKLGRRWIIRHLLMIVYLRIIGY